MKVGLTHQLIFTSRIARRFIIRYSKLNVVLQVGGYIHANYYKYARVYSRVGIRYEFADNYCLMSR
jgi:hypothetical protein